MQSRLSPVDVVFRLVGGPVVVAAICRQDRTTSMKWRTAGPRREAGDIPPGKMRELLLYARANDIPLTAEHLILGADEAEIEALCTRTQVAAE